MESRGSFEGREDSFMQYRAVLVEYMAVLVEYRAVLVEYMAVLVEYRAVLVEHMAVLVVYQNCTRTALYSTKALYSTPPEPPTKEAPTASGRVYGLFHAVQGCFGRV